MIHLFCRQHCAYWWPRTVGCWGNGKHKLDNVQISCIHKSCTCNVHSSLSINTLRQRHNERHFSDDIFSYICLNEYVWFPITISLKFVPTGVINNIPALVQIMAWRLPGDKPSSESIMVSSLTHIVSRGKMEHGGKMEHRVFWKNHTRRGSIFKSTWFLSSASSASCMEIKLAIDHVFSISQKRNFTLLISIYSRFDIKCFDKLSSRAAACG